MSMRDARSFISLLLNYRGLADSFRVIFRRFDVSMSLELLFPSYVILGFSAAAAFLPKVIHSFSQVKSVGPDSSIVGSVLLEAIVCQTANPLDSIEWSGQNRYNIGYIVG